MPFPYALIDIDEPSARVVADGVGWLKQVESHPVLQPYICPLVRNDPINTVAYVVFYDGSRGVDSPHESNTGYALNEWIFGYRTGNAPYPLRGKLTDIRSPANVLLAGDADIAKRRFPYGIWSMNDRPEPPTLDHYARGIAAKYGIAPDLGRHHGGLNLLFADGHVEGRGESQLDTVFLK